MLFYIVPDLFEATDFSKPSKKNLKIRHRHKVYKKAKQAFSGGNVGALSTMQGTSPYKGSYHLHRKAGRRGTHNQDIETMASRRLKRVARKKSNQTSTAGSDKKTVRGMLQQVRNSRKKPDDFTSRRKLP